MLIGAWKSVFNRTAETRAPVRPVNVGPFVHRQHQRQVGPLRAQLVAPGGRWARAQPDARNTLEEFPALVGHPHLEVGRDDRGDEELGAQRRQHAAATDAVGRVPRAAQSEIDDSQSGPCSAGLAGPAPKAPFASIAAH